MDKPSPQVTRPFFGVFLLFRGDFVFGFPKAKGAARATTSFWPHETNPNLGVATKLRDQDGCFIWWVWNNHLFV